jgi:hypothetical protein
MIDQFFLSLRDEAISWHNALERRPGFDLDDWDAVKKEFLAAYVTKYTALSICTTIQTLCQKTEETVQMFFNRVDTVFDNAKFVRPANVMEYQGDPAYLQAAQIPAVNPNPDANPPIVGHGLIPAVNIPRDRADRLVSYGAGQMERYLMMVVFVGGLKTELRDELLKKDINTAEQALDEARKIEIILRDEKEKRTKGIAVTSVTQEEEDEIMMIEEGEVEHVEALNAIRRRQGKKPFRYRVKGGSSGNGKTCHYCKRLGHFIRDCHKRKANEERNNSGQSSNPYQSKALN